MLITTWHPTYAFFHNPFEWGAFAADLDRFARAIRGQLRPPPAQLITNARAEDIRRVADGQKFIAVDIETGASDYDKPWTGKDPTRARLKTIGFGGTEAGCSFFWDGASRETRAEALRLLQDPGVLKVFHNGHWFDLRVLRRYGCGGVGPVVDTRDMRRSLATTSPLALRYLASLYDDVFPWKEGDEDDGSGVVFTQDKEALMRYNAMDCVVTARVYEGMLRETEWSEARTRLLYDTHTQLSTIAAEMHTRGIFVHQRNRQFMVHCLEQEIQERSQAFLAAVGIPGMRCTPNDMRSLIYKRHENSRVKRFSLPDPLDPRMFTNDQMNAISVDEGSLLMLIVGGGCPPELVPLIDLYWEAESAKKKRTFLISQLVDQSIGEDGRLRPGWNSCGTNTMRWACNEPNIMNIEQQLRAYLAPSPGYAFVHADKSALELRVMAAVAEDQVLQDRLNAGDVYSEDAKDWFKLPRDMDVKKLNPAVRQQCKIIHLASQYAAGIPAIYAQALRQDRKMRFDAVRLLNMGFKRAYHRTVSYWHEEMARVMRQGYSEGRLLQGRRYYPRPPPITEVANWPIQRTASEMMSQEMLTLDARLKAEVPSAGISMILHDAFDVECKEKDIERVKAIMNEVMDREYVIGGWQSRFPIEVKVTRSSQDGSWADV